MFYPIATLCRVGFEIKLTGGSEIAVHVHALLASFFLPSHLSLNMYMYMHFNRYMYMKKEARKKQARHIYIHVIMFHKLTCYYIHVYVHAH